MNCSGFDFERLSEVNTGKTSMRLARSPKVVEIESGFPGSIDSDQTWSSVTDGLVNLTSDVRI